jgi:DNA polymerase IV
MALEFPLMFLLSTHLEAETLQRLEDEIPTLTYDINEAEVVLGNISRKQRALFELRKHKLETSEIPGSDDPADSPRRKRVRTTAPVDDVSDTASEAEFGAATKTTPVKSSAGTVKVVKLCWFTDSQKAGKVLPLGGDYLLYEGRKVPKTPVKSPSLPRTPRAEDVLKRAMADAAARPGARPGSSQGYGRQFIHRSSPPPMLRQTTTDDEGNKHLPPIPEYLHSTYSCQRPTPVHPPNEAFIEQLTKIRTARTLAGDQIGVRAYSSAIATIAAYPYTISSALGKASRSPTTVRS